MKLNVMRIPTLADLRTVWTAQGRRDRRNETLVAEWRRLEALEIAAMEDRALELAELPDASEEIRMLAAKVRQKRATRHGL